MPCNLFFKNRIFLPILTVLRLVFDFCGEIYIILKRKLGILKKENFMHHVKGIICIAKMPTGLFLFGRNSDQENSRYYEALETNGIAPFKNTKEARRAAYRLRQVFDVVGASLAKIDLIIAENEKDLEKLKKIKHPLVVLKKSEGGAMCFLGRMVENKPSAYPLPGAYLYQNGLKGFEKFSEAYHLAIEVNRQGRCGALISAFVLTKIRSTARR